MHIYVWTAAYQVNFENRNGNIISSKEYLLNTNITDVPKGLLADGSKAISWSIKGDDSGLEYSAETIKNLKVNANITFVPTQVEVPVTFYRKIANNQYEKYGVGFLEESVLQ